MPTQSFTIQYDGIAQALMTEAFVAPAFDPKTTAAPPAIVCKGLWDTGATNTVITSKVAAECNLKPISVAEVSTANGITTANVYLVAIGLPNGVGIPIVRVTECSLSPGIDLLIGMDIIKFGDFAITNLGGKTTFSFRTPSSECIDFVKQGEPPKVGRNDPCPCGSGKKFKKCHGSK